jgi:hypothetical protein
VTDNFTAIGGANQFFKAFGGPAMGVESGNLCYNIGVNYANNTNYSFESPDYSAAIAAKACNTINVSFNVVGKIRASDVFIFCVYNSSWTCYTVTPTTTATTYTITLANTYKKYSFDLYTGSTGSLSTKYVHIDWFKINCATSLPIELILFEGEKGNLLTWSTASELNNDYFILESSVDGVEWKPVATLNGSGTSMTENNYQFTDNYFVPDTINYYRLSQVDFDGARRIYTDKMVAIDNRQRLKYIVKTVDFLGRGIPIDTPGIVLVIYQDGTIEKILNEE